MLFGWVPFVVKEKKKENTDCPFVHSSTGLNPAASLAEFQFTFQNSDSRRESSVSATTMRAIGGVQRDDG